MINLKILPSTSNNFKIKLDQLDVDKLVPVHVDLSKLSDVVKSDVLEKHLYNDEIENTENKITDITNLAINQWCYRWNT